MKTPGHVRSASFSLASRSLHSGSFHITSLLFSRCTVEPVTPMAHRGAMRRSVASG